MFYRFDSPLGPIAYDWNGELCVRLELTADTKALSCSDDPVAQWLHDYFTGQATELPPLAKPATPFQQKMRAGLLAIPFGEVRTYGQLAGQLNTAPRAMGQALGANPLPILIPCHRVVAADGLGGFGCGLAWKKKLLDFEYGFSAQH
ncbi:methylated-DNA--[protein]-cysteine S-methyltransferase [Mariprofundus ferrooxydans]|nr:methylated-DNA--[protein]-cysteine S-methyltransferase [Mariprofundus ferrooxydans]